jgi:hypothetical protein
MARHAVDRVLIFVQEVFAAQFVASRFGLPRGISDCHFAVQLNHFIPGFLSYSVAVFSKVTIGYCPRSALPARQDAGAPGADGVSPPPHPNPGRLNNLPNRVGGLKQSEECELRPGRPEQKSHRVGPNRGSNSGFL